MLANELLHNFNQLFAFGLLDESSPMLCMFLLALIANLWNLVFIQFVVAVRTIFFDGKYSPASAVYVFVDWAIGTVLTLTIVGSPFGLIFIKRATINAFTAKFVEVKPQ